MRWGDWARFAVVMATVVKPVLAQWGDRYLEALIALFGCFLSLLVETQFCQDPTIDSGECVCSLAPAFATLIGCVRSFTTSDFNEELAKLCPQNALDTAINASYQWFMQFATHDLNRTDVPVNLTDTTTSDYVSSFRHYLGNYNTLVRLAAALVGYWAVIMVIHAIVLIIRPWVAKYNWRWLRRYLTTPALASFHKDTAVTINGIDVGLVPSRYQLVVIAGFIGFTVFLTVTNISYWNNDKVFVNMPYPKTQALAHMIGDRSGILATFLIPLLVAFAGRNNLLQSITGVNYATFVCYHRWILRVVVVELIVHAIAFTVYFRSNAWTEYRQVYMIGGIVGLLAMLVLVIQAFMALRRRWYEAFLAIHIIASVVMIGALVVHLWHLGWLAYIWYALAVWGLDRVARVVRIVAFGAKRAQITLIDDTLRVVIPVSSNKQYPPGGHVFLHFATSFKAVWQSHPFTYIIDDALGDMVVFIKVKQGITAKLAQHLSQLPVPTDEITVLVDGVYGEPAPYLAFDRVVFVAGGHGIPGLFNELQSYANTGVTTRLVWVSRSHRWFHRYLGYLPHTVDVELYSTSPDYDEHNQVPLVVKFEKGRANMTMLVAEEVANTHGSVAFVGCGHPALMDDLRAAVAAVDHTHHVEFFDQLQVWA